jgi:FkbH-like protein
MTFTEALKILQKADKNAPLYRVAFACGFTPLHVETLLAGYLQKSLPARRVTITPGMFGDVAGTIEGLREGSADCVAVALEWADLDARLDYRSAGSWGVETPGDIVDEAGRMLARIAAAIARKPAGIKVTVSLPTLPLPPVFHTPGWQAGAQELLLQRHVLDFATQVATSGHAVVVNGRRLDEVSPIESRFDLKANLLTGLPYTMRHAVEVAALLAANLLPASPKKGIVTDLDDTLWSGIVGEVGADGVQWDLASHQQFHGLYQKLLNQLSEQGVLVAVASKNDPALVERAFARADLLLKPERVFPMEVHWNAKSGSVARILKTWNIGADSVIFIDDSPMELAEVKAAHPEVECIAFPKQDLAAGFSLLRRLRDLCGKERIGADDKLRLESIRRNADFQQESDGGSGPEEFLKQVCATVTLDFESADDARVLELVNKTNQFNLNGARFTESDWRRLSTESGAVVATVSYQDKFGPLGKVAVLGGQTKNGVLHVTTWVMSCRAFARRIEHQCLQVLFERYGVDEMEFQFAPTAKNGPLQDFFAALLGSKPDGPFRIGREQFAGCCPALYHNVEQTRRIDANG